MSKIVYTTTNTKPAVEMMLANALADLVPRVGLKNVESQAHTLWRPQDAVGSFILCFKLTDEGENLLFTGIAGPGDFKKWPADGAPELDWAQYPIDRS